jgi:hypothetical protein
VDNKQILIKARELLADERNWTKGAAARDAQGNETDVDSEEAVCFCVLGAIRHITDRVIQNSMDRLLLDVVAEVTGTRDYVHLYNDDPSTTHSDILKFLDRAIQLA